MSNDAREWVEALIGGAIVVGTFLFIMMIV